MSDPIPTKPAGYDALIRHYSLKAPPHNRRTSIAERGIGRVERYGHVEWHTLPKAYEPTGETFLSAQLEFALKHEGLHLPTLAVLFAVPGVDKELEQYVRTKPTGIYARKAWYLYELLTGRELDLPDVQQGNYVDLLDPDDYVTTHPEPSRRHRVRDNLLGRPGFCPVVQKSVVLQELMGKNLAGQAREIVAQFDPAILHRAAQYLYVKETKSSYEIERERPDQGRMVRFIEVLKEAHRVKVVDKNQLVEVQQSVLDPRYAEYDYRGNQVYVGEAALSGREIIHHVGANAKDVESLMEGLLQCLERMAASEVDPVVQAAVGSFGFVFIHPFEDGNGRIHRFLIHQILARSGFTPEGLVFPVSAIMLADRRAYDDALESVSRPHLDLIDYVLAPDGSIIIHNETDTLYRYWDGTALTEYLYRAVERTITQELAEELRFLVGYDQAKRRMQDIVDMPDRKLDLFIRLVHQAGGTLSKGKRASAFPELTDTEVSALEAVVREALVAPA